MPKFLMLGIALFLLLAAAGYGLTTIQARSIPWDCADWQAFAHADRTTAILESLAENRGKTLYCGVDQSDTFAKAETWEAGKDRNERDDTVYFGERGQFRGFIAAQEGYLTDGESGVTGVSIDRIFEFPREERRRTKRVKRWDISSGSAATDTCPDPEGGRTPGTLACSGWGAQDDNLYGTSSAGAARRDAQGIYARKPQDGDGNNAWAIHWDTQAFYNPHRSNRLTGDYASPSTEEWTALAAAVAKEICREQHGGQSVSNVVIGQGHSNDRTPANNRDRGPHLGWFFDDVDDRSNIIRYRARQSRTWTATCKKTTRHTRK